MSTCFWTLKQDLKIEILNSQLISVDFGIKNTDKDMGNVMLQ